ncbi:MAG: fumarylacetoacetate hydrolase family protein [Caldilineaceae bacterium]|nr:fumarylacetoacetate hydrolase family protein [Caldilineaceae bacterium]
MKLALFAFGQEDHVGIVEEDGIFDLTRAMQAYDLFNKNIQTAPVTSIHEMLDKNMVRPAVIEPVVDFIDRHNLRQALTVPEGAADHPLRTPIRRPGKIIALGGNYSFPGYPDPEEPPFFFKVATSVIGSDEPIIYKKIMKQVEPEIELAAVIGARASDVPEEEAMQYVAGYTVLNDVTARDLQNAAWDIQRPWEYTKSIDTFTPVGPHLVLPEAVSDPHDLAMIMRVNGEVVAEASTNTMLFRIPFLIEYLSQYMTLEPGDIIATGTPAHPEALHPGDVIELDVAEVGVLRNPIVAEG